MWVVKWGVVLVWLMTTRTEEGCDDDDDDGLLILILYVCVCVFLFWTMESSARAKNKIQEDCSHNLISFSPLYLSNFDIKLCYRIFIICIHTRRTKTHIYSID